MAPDRTSRPEASEASFRTIATVARPTTRARSGPNQRPAATSRELLPAPVVFSPAMRLAMAVFANGSAVRWNIVAKCLEMQSLNDACNYAEIARSLGVSELKVLRDMRKFRQSMRVAIPMAGLTQTCIFNAADSNNAGDEADGEDGG